MLVLQNLYVGILFLTFADVVALWSCIYVAAKNGGKFCAFAFFLYLCSHSHGVKQMMKIVILDGYGANPGDLSWDGLSEVGQVTVYDRTAVETTLE